MTNALVPRPTQPLPDGREVEPGKVPGVSEPRVDLRRLYTYCSLLLLGLGFFLAARSWVAFGEQEGIPEGLFTQTDFPAVVVASRLIASGAGSHLYEYEAQLAG